MSTAQRKAYRHFRNRHGFTALQAWSFVRTMPRRA